MTARAEPPSIDTLSSDVFVAALFAKAAPQDMAGYDQHALQALAETCFAHLRRAEPGKSLVDLIDVGADTVLIAVNDDSPFLFDSVLNETTAQGARLKAAFHPILNDAGRAISVIVLVLEPIADQSRRAALVEAVRGALGDVRLAVQDWQHMRAKLDEAAATLRAAPPPCDGEWLEESLAFLAWLGDNHFTFLGCRDYAFTGDTQEPVAGSGLGLLSDDARRIVRQSDDPAQIDAELRAFLIRPEPLIIAKSNEISRVHRRVYMDYIGVKRFDAAGALIGERRFVGLFTAGAYTRRPLDIPLLRLKSRRLTASAALTPHSHDARALAHILDTFPRDELFQADCEEILETALGILRLGARPLVRLFPRFDRFSRFVTAIVFLPRDRYDSGVRDKVHGIVARHYRGRPGAMLPSFGETALARLYCTVEREDGPLAIPDVADIEAEIRLCIRTWEDGLLEALRARHGIGEGERIFLEQAGDIPASYRDAFAPAEAVEDLARLTALAKAGQTTPAAEIWRAAADPPTQLRLKLYGLGEAPDLSLSLPVFEHFGLTALCENAYPLRLFDNGAAFVLDFTLRRADGLAAGLDAIKHPLQAALHAVLEGRAESDGFNRLVMAAALSWREAAMVRACAKYLRQSLLPFGQDTMEQALARNPDLTRHLVAFFHARLDPASRDEEKAATLARKIETALGDVQSLDDDRIIRAFANLIGAILRTNYYQPGEVDGHKPTIAFKLDSRQIEALPAPRPLVEIFVHAPAVEGVHLRFAKVARGGLRWSDRRDDFRTEVLGLVKAQKVKNAVIVPAGAKGGFYPKALPASGSREEAVAEAIKAYRLFIGALLDVTDNIDTAGKVIPPESVVRHDGDDPYLVVAADKGTASFSDIANDIALSRGFWLGDAFASGGSHGYDHKKMGITAKGAWVAVKRHFREMERDCQVDPFTCIGIGDMSGDVFGNAMLLSKATKLLAAFDHRHIFLDPDPDPAASWQERKRLFDLPRSCWADYDPALISKGGGVFARDRKAVPLSEEARALTGFDAAYATPAELIRALLRAPVDLLFFGGIGTFVKASGQSHAEVGDRAGDALRIDARELRAKVIGEGANLGLTQLARIEAAEAGVRLNTDAIDNAAGVDTSDHEVNLKILIGGAVDAARRDALLGAMTEDVAALVLKHNEEQTLALSVAHSRAALDLDAHGRFMRDLEARLVLDRALETLPDDASLRRRAGQGAGLTRPELAVLIAYAKLDLKAALAEGTLADDPALAGLLAGYFPKLAAGSFKAELARHRLRREIVIAAFAGRLVDLAGPVFMHRLKEISGADDDKVARAFFAADTLFGLSELKERLLAAPIKAADQIEAIADIGEVMRRLCLWFVVNMPSDADLCTAIARFRPGHDALRGRLAAFVPVCEAEAIAKRIEALIAAGADEGLADRAGALPVLGHVPEILLLAEAGDCDPMRAAGAYFAAGRVCGIDSLRLQAQALRGADHWERVAIRRICDDLYAGQRQLAAAALQASGAEGRQAVEDWAQTRQNALSRLNAFNDALAHSGPLSVAKLSLASSQIRELA